VASTTDTFLAVEPAESDRASARYAVLPVPYEGTATYMKGTASAPAAIIEASHHVELFDEEMKCEFSLPGVATLPPVAPAGDPAVQMSRVKGAALPIVRSGRFLLALGGEHSITAPLVEACAAAYGSISVLQIDAHADLRDSYLGTKHSHACVMRRVLETTPNICQVGIRSYSQEEQLACPERAAAFITPRAIARDMSWVDRAIRMLPAPVYITVDVDGLDPSIAPGVGTPEPGGLTWQQVLKLLRGVCARRQVVAADVVEARPIPPNHVTEFVAARLACKIIAYTQQHPSSAPESGDRRQTATTN